MSKQRNISTSECFKCGNMHAHEGPEIKNFKCINCERHELIESQRQESGPNAVFDVNKALDIVSVTYENGQWKTTYIDGTFKYGFGSRKSRSTRKRSARKSRSMRRKNTRKSIRRKSVRKSRSRKIRKSVRKSRSRK